ncbi:MAG: ferritin-like domain-containing protein, partial [Actinomycetota bacterium]|nr:ferritin-like domain-containing protein [Actinomycetota bacterium]
MATSTSQLLSELNTLLRLTQTEAVIASTRVAQASTPAIARELSRNAEEARRRTRELSDAIRDLGGVPNVVAAAVGRVGAVAKAQLEQGQTLTDALLGDLALEHELRDRAHLLKLLAESASNPKLVRLAERVVNDHAETIAWIETRLAEVAVGGPAAIRPTPAQATVGAVRRLASLPVRQAAAGFNRAANKLGDLRRQTGAVIDTNVERASQLRDAAGEIFTSGRDAALERTERVAREDGAGKTAETVHDTRAQLGALRADELPIRGYDELSAADAASRVEQLDDPADVRAVLSFETANKGRKRVVDAAQRRLETIAAEKAGTAPAATAAKAKPKARRVTPKRDEL